MSTERDRKFQGFAKLLWDELIEANGHGSIDVDTTFDDGIDPTNYRLLIAQRAYDLVQHTIDTLWVYIDDRAVDPSPADIPDLTEWPPKSAD